jgi:hypothetical protein
MNNRRSSTNKPDVCQKRVPNLGASDRDLVDAAQLTLTVTTRRARFQNVHASKADYTTNF